MIAIFSHHIPIILNLHLWGFRHPPTHPPAAPGYHVSFTRSPEAPGEGTRCSWSWRIKLQSLGGKKEKMSV